MSEQNLYSDIDTQRRDNGFLSLSETMALTQRGNTVLDPFSTLISVHAKIGRDNVFYPSVTLRADRPEAIVIGNANTFYPMSYLEASGPDTNGSENNYPSIEGGVIEIGSGNQFGPEGGVSIKANSPGTCIKIGDNGRYLSGAMLLGNSTFGDGAQVLGSITVQNCILEAGDPFSGQDPDLRAAVIKGRGLIRGQTIHTGKVAVVGEASSQITLHEQSYFHPKKG
ncbi:hypothetical protein [Kiloniella antarctica]|uniref:Uncharacterized protein n=1 Tax=Kiloniella antarctica TaxID=1550907 RepID=A0ABW5BHY9_9PROT